MNRAEVGSNLEEAAAWMIAHLGPQKLAGEPVRNYRGLAERKYELDFAWPTYKLGVEIQGGVNRPRFDRATGKRLGTAHTGEGQTRDMRKLNTYQIAGWIVLQFCGQMIDEDPYGCAADICLALQVRGA